MLMQVREDIRHARALAAARGEDDVVQLLDSALATVAPERLLTTTEAAEYLQIRSVNTLKALVRAEQLHVVYHGNRMMIPLAELERVREGTLVRAIQASDRDHDQADVEFGTAGLTEEQLAALEAGRPGRLPWYRDGISAEGGSR